MTRVPSLNSLRSEAARATNRRNHHMRWQMFEAQAIGTCAKCGAGVNVLLIPAPNQIAIGGEAVAVNCKPKRRQYANSPL